MGKVRIIYNKFCKFEELLVQIFLGTLMVLVFLSAVCRSLRVPINWAVDVSMLLFAWTVFLGADVALRNTGLVKVDLIIKKLSPNIQKTLNIVWGFIIITFLFSLVWYGIPLSIESSKRLFWTLGISYSWATVSVPAGSFLMIVSNSIKLYNTVKNKNVGKG
jgi:C4-dicarboxylate transporter, DctQ subunit